MCVLQVLARVLLAACHISWFSISSLESHYVIAAIVSAGGCRVMVEFRPGLGFQNPWSLEHKQRRDVYYSVFQLHFKPEFLRIEVFFFF